MAFCPRCGSENKSEARFCHQCGATLQAGANPETPAPDAVARAPGSSRRWGMIGLFVLGLLATGALGYWLGGHQAAVPAEPAQTQAPPPPETLGAKPPRPSPARETAPSEPAGAKSAPPRREDAKDTPEPDPHVQYDADTPEQRLAKLRHDLSQCGRFNVFCQEKARWKYCPGWWNKVPECPQADAHLPSR